MELVELSDGMAVCTTGISLCAGIGGMDRGLKLAFGERYKTVCYVEKDSYCASVLVARMEDKALDSAPIWDQLETFQGAPWRGRVDLITAGFSCQPFSTASRGRKTSKDLWPEVFRVFKEIRPNFGFFENVQKSPIEKAAIDLASVGYKSIFMPLCASELGAPFVRRRWWLFSHFNCHSESARSLYDQTSRLSAPEKTSKWENLPDKILGVGDGISAELDKRERLRVLGNAVIPQVAANAIRILMKSL